jgi:transposase-like protein
MNTTPAEFPETLLEAIKYFGNPDISLAFMVSMRWPSGVVKCPACNCDRVGFLASRRLWKCKGCAKQFSVKVGTIFEDSPLGLDKWLPAVWCIVNAKNGISSCELARALGVTQKTAWFMLHRIRLAMAGGSIMKGKMSGTVEADETFVGGRAINMHRAVKERRGVKMGGYAAKTTVMGLLQRPTEAQPVSKVTAKVLLGLPTTKEANETLQANVEKGSEVFTDYSKVYEKVKADYAHAAVDHAVEYVRDNVHTNGLENFWCLLKRALKGTYVSVEPCHLFRYVGEQVFRFNERKNENGDSGRFVTAMAHVFGKRIMYKQLIGAFGATEGDSLPA